MNINNSRGNKTDRCYALFAMLILINGICSSILGTRIIKLEFFSSEPLILSGGIIPFCISFTLLDIVTNQYGYRKAKEVIVNYLICKAIMCLLLYLIMQIDTALPLNEANSYKLVITMILKSFWASLLGTLVAFFLNSYIFSNLYMSFKGKHLWLRCLVATTLGEIVFSLVSTPVLFYDILSINNIGVLIFHNYSFKLVFELITLPFIYIMVYLLNKYENNNYIGYINFEPIHKQINPLI